MNKKFKKLIPLFLLALFVWGCEGQKITDVGNPTDRDLPEALEELPHPLLEQLEGPYEKRTSETTTQGVSTCSYDPKSEQQIRRSNSKGKIILENFLDYSASTKQIEANYENGEISFEIKNATLDLSCNGQAFLIDEQISFSLSCNTQKPSLSTCKTPTFIKVNNE